MPLPSLIDGSKQRVRLPLLPPLLPHAGFISHPIGLPIDGLTTPPDQTIPNPLPFDLEPQQPNSNRCWTAVAVSVARFFDSESPWTQDTLVAKIFEGQDCMADTPLPCDKTLGLQLALAETGNLGNGKFEAAPDNAHLGIIVDEITGGRPVPCRVAVGGTTGHFIVICGIHALGSDFLLNIQDPLFYTMSDCTATDLRERYLHDERTTWTDIYFTKKKEDGNGN